MITINECEVPTCSDEAKLGVSLGSADMTKYCEAHTLESFCAWIESGDEADHGPRFRATKIDEEGGD